MQCHVDSSCSAGSAAQDNRQRFRLEKALKGITFLAVRNDSGAEVYIVAGHGHCTQRHGRQGSVLLPMYLPTRDCVGSRMRSRHKKK